MKEQIVSYDKSLLITAALDNAKRKAEQWVSEDETSENLRFIHGNLYDAAAMGYVAGWQMGLKVARIMLAKALHDENTISLATIAAVGGREKSAEIAKAAVENHKAKQ